MKVMIITGSFPPIKCGIADYTDRLVHNLKDLDYEVLTSSEAAKQAHITPIVSRWSWRGWPTIRRRISSYQPDIIHFQHPSVKYPRRLYINLLPLLLRARFPKIALVVTIHEYHDSSRLGRWRIILTVMFVKNVIVTNIEDETILQKSFPHKTINQIPIGSNIEKADLSAESLYRLRSKYNPNNKKLITYFGYVDATKGIEQAIKAANDWPKDTKLLIIGEYASKDPYHQHLKKLIAECSADIEWTGFIDCISVSGLLQLSDIAVLPFDKPASFRRGSLLAALSHGVPTITTGPVNSPLKDLDNCYAISTNHPADITRAVVRLLEDNKLAKKLRTNSLSLGHNFGWETIGQKHQNLYSSIVKLD